MEVEKRGRGRPPGATNKPAAYKEMVKQTNKLYKDIEHMLTPEQREYFSLAFQGRAEFDAVLEAELFLRFFSVYVTKVLSDQVADPDMRMLKDFSGVLGQYNTALKTVEDMKNKRVEMDIKKNNGNDGRVVGSTRESALGRLEGVFEKYTDGATG